MYKTEEFRKIKVIICVAFIFYFYVSRKKNPPNMLQQQRP